MLGARLRSLLGAAVGLAATCWVAAPAPAAELYLAGDIGISSISGDGNGFNELAGLSNAGEGSDASPVYGAALGVAFPLGAAVPWGARIPGFSIPYWPGHSLDFAGSEDFRLPDWEVRFEVEHLRGRDVQLTTDSFTPFDPYRADVTSWSLMGKLRLDVPVRRPVHAFIGRVPFLEPLTLYLGGGAGFSETELDVNHTGSFFGSDQTGQFAWQALAGFGYRLNEQVKWSFGWRYQDLGSVSTRLVDTAQIDRGRYGIDLHAHEFTTSLGFTFWRVPFLGDE